MNKFTYALALGAGLVLSLAAPNAQADPIVQSLTTADMSACKFNSLFTPTAGVAVMTQNLLVLEHRHGRHRVIGSVHGKGCGRGRVCLCVPVHGVNNATDTTTGEPTSVNSTSMLFNATPVVTSFTGSNAAAYVVTDGAVGSV